jgi:hypothetical protein
MAHDHDVYMILVETAVEQEDIESLRKFTPLLEELASRDRHKLYTAIAHRAWGVAQRLAGEKEESESRLGDALMTFRELNTRWQIGKTLFEMGKTARSFLDLAAASENFVSALAEFEALGAKPDSQRTRNELEAIDMPNSLPQP